MDQSPGSAMAGSFIPLSDQEQRCYSALFTWCQADSAGTLSAARVGELFRASQLPADTLRQVMEVCGAKQQGYFGPTQFQLALKLLSAAQAGLPVRLESIKGELPLPRFSGMKNYAEDRYPAHSQHGDPRGSHFGVTAAQTQRRGEDRSTFKHRDSSAEKQDPQAPSLSPRNSPPTSPSNFPTSTYSTQRNGADTLVAQAMHGPPRTVAQQDSSSPGHHGSRPPVEHHTIPQAYLAERLVDHSAEDYPDDPWRITEEQLEYYTNQFKSLQPDLGALILGAVAKDFFTKSKLPIPELSFIWELSDVDRDGALTFLEFCTAFHLIVARKNGFPLPESLPPSLQASLTAHDGAPPRPVGEDSFFGVPFTQVEKVPVTSEKTEPLISFEETEAIQEKPGVHKQSSVAEMALSKHSTMEEPSQSVAIQKRAEEIQDKESETTNTVTEMPDLACKVDPHMRPRSRPRSYSSTSISEVVKKTEVPPTPPPRRQKTHSRASSLDLNKLFQQSSQGLKSALFPFPTPPALPPRPPVTQVQHFVATAEQDSQKALQQPDFADFSKFQEVERTSEQNQLCKATTSAEDTVSSKTVTGQSQQLLQKPARRKHRLESQNLDPDLSSFPAFTSGNKPTQKLSSRQKKEIQMAIRKNRETNAVLARLNSELQQQLKNVHQERIALESQLEDLRPVAFL